jgi:hypothetical protein
VFKGSGMKLGSKKGKQNDLLDALGGEAVEREEEHHLLSPAPAASPSPVPAASPAAQDVLPHVQRSR